MVFDAIFGVVLHAAYVETFQLHASVDSTSLDQA